MRNVIKMKYAVVILVVLCGIVQSKDDNICNAAVNCKDCLNAEGTCKWCGDPDFTKLKGNKYAARCDLKTTLEGKGCKDIQISDGEVKRTDTSSFSSTTQVIPKKLTVTLRPGEVQSIKLQVKPAENYPVRLYYLMDMSNSMEDDLINLRTLGRKIANEMNKITTNFQLAFGTFVDKTVTPFIQERKPIPCDGCEKTFGYHHVFDFNKDAKKFEDSVTEQAISGNLDTPEGGFDALMQVTVCGDQVWPKEEFTRKIVVFVTDATPHIAGDGKIGGITVPNDGQCHLKTNPTTNKKMYAETNNMDYPSISFLKEKMKENEIVPIIAVTKEVEPIYRKLQKEWKDLGTGLGTLANDSSNIVKLIRDKYSEIASRISLNDNSPDDIVVKYKVVGGCTNVKENECHDVKIGDTVDFRVDVKAVKCPENYKDPRSFKITVPGFGNVEVDVKYICECECDKVSARDDDPRCNGTGSFRCGICDCNKGRFGKNCECDSEAQADTSLCIMPNSTDKSICSNFGTCVCGKCECNEQSDKSRKISGTFCQCNNFGCDRYKGLICGGPSRGECKCGKCDCTEAFLGDNCGQRNCTLGKKECISPADGKICSGHGQCRCDTCECEIGYSGRHCEKCVSCAGKCQNNEDCVLCAKPYNVGEPELCNKCNLNIVLVNDTSPAKYGPKKCSVPLNGTCRVSFSIDSRTDNETVYVNETPECITYIPTEAPILIIVLGIIGGIVLVGLLLLLAWKLIVTAYDQHEYHKFEKDRMKSKWENAENPIYRPSKQQFQNPAYAGNQKNN